MLQLSLPLDLCWSLSYQQYQTAFEMSQTLHFHSEVLMPPDFDTSNNLRKSSKQWPGTEWLTSHNFTNLYTNPTKITQHHQTNQCGAMPSRTSARHGITQQQTSYISLAIGIDLRSLSYVSWQSRLHCALSVFCLMIQKHCIRRVVEAVTQAQFSATLLQSKSHWCMTGVSLSHQEASSSKQLLGNVWELWKVDEI